MFLTLSGELMTVANRPMASTVPVMPPGRDRSPTLNGRRKIRNAPAAKLASRPPQARRWPRRRRRGARQRGGLDAEEPQEGDDQRHVQHDPERGLQVAHQGHVEFVLRDRPAEGAQANEISQRPTRKSAAAPATSRHGESTLAF